MIEWKTVRDEDRTNLKTTLGMHNGHKYIRNGDGSNSSMRQPKYAAYISVITQPTVWCHTFGTWKVNFRMVKTCILCKMQTSRCPCDYLTHECWAIRTRFKHQNHPCKQKRNRISQTPYDHRVSDRENEMQPEIARETEPHWHMHPKTKLRTKS